MALATANRACMCPPLGCLATLRRIRAHPLVAAPWVFVCPFAVAPRALGSPSCGDLSTLRPALSCAQGTNALGLAARAFSASLAGSTPAVPFHLPLLCVARCEGLHKSWNSPNQTTCPGASQCMRACPRASGPTHGAHHSGLESVSILDQHMEGPQLKARVL